MSFRRHKTPTEKFLRRFYYSLLKASGISAREAAIFRDWTTNKIFMICRGARPIR